MDMRPLEIQRDGPAGLYYEIKLNKNIIDYSIDPADSNFTVYHNFGEDKRTIRFYNTFENIDSLEFYLSAYDSLDQVINDTLYLKFTESRRKKAEFTYSIVPKDGEDITDDFQAIISFNKPIQSIQTDSLYFKYDSLTYQFIPRDSIYPVNQRLDEFTINMDLFFTEYLEKIAEADTTQPATIGRQTTGPGMRGVNRRQAELNLHIEKGGFVSVDLDTLNDIDYNYQKLRPENYGIIRGTVISDNNSFTIQLLNKQNLRIQEEIKNKVDYSFNRVKPGDYIIRVFIDNNSNGKWDPGNIFQREEPEEVYFYPDIITVRANWEITDINLEF
jgi:hypothetical protein